MICQELSLPMKENLKNPHYDDCYFSNVHGLEESRHVFIEGNDLPERIRGGEIPEVGETGFGTGLNLLSLLGTVQRESAGCCALSFSSIEKYPLPAARIEELLDPFREELTPNLDAYLRQWESFSSHLNTGWNKVEWEFDGIDLALSLYHGDALEWAALPKGGEGRIAAWFLDGHSPDRNPEIWSLPVMQAVYDRTAAGGTLSSFTASGLVKTALREAGFFIKRSKGFGRKRHMIRGFKS
jgi:tRNA U34 5-methylaminomethyl-2-thiouridine-forming methyltransferase MnmC